MDDYLFTGKMVKLEPLDHSHISGLVKAAASNPFLYRWTFVPQGEKAIAQYIDIAMAAREAGTAYAFAITGTQDGIIKGTTRYWNMEYWQWPEHHPMHGKKFPDVCEIGHTWLTESAIKTGINTEAKLLLLTNAFENWQAIRVCFRTDVRNTPSRTAIERIGGKFEGIIRADRMATDFTVRDSCRYSIIATEWKQLKQQLIKKLYL
jgi:RimJ/RimL family protein N-acetyltransferase